MKRLAVKLYARGKGVLGNSLYRNSLYLLASSACVALTGVVFWTLAARLFPAHVVGVVSTLIATATFVASASIFGLDHTLIRYLERHQARFAGIMHTVFTVALLGAIGISLLYMAVIPAFVPELGFVLQTPVWIAAFMVVMLLTTWNNLLTSLFIAVRATQYVLFAGLAFGCLRLVLLPFFQDFGVLGLFGAHGIAFGVGVIVGLWGAYAVRRYIYRPQLAPWVIQLVKGYSLQTYAASLLASMPPLLTPLLVIGMLGAAAAAYYSIPLMIIGLLNLIAMASAQSLFAEGAADEQQLRRHVKKSLQMIYLLLTPAVIGVVVLGNVVLHLFGPEYANQGYSLLVLLACASLFKGATYPLMTILRLRGYVKEIIFITLGYVLVLLALVFGAISIWHSLWAIGAAVLVAEASVLGVYSMIVYKKWWNVSVSAAENPKEEFLNV